MWLSGWRRLTTAVRRMRCRKKNRPSIRIPFPEAVTIWLDVWFDFFWPMLANEVGAGQPAITSLVCALRRDGCAVRGLMCPAQCCCRVSPLPSAPTHVACL